MRIIFTSIIAFLASMNLFAGTNELVLKFNHKSSNAANLSSFIEAHKQNNKSNRIVFEFFDSNKPTLIKAAGNPEEVRNEIYKKSYPNGDFYYLIAGLGDSWSKSDYERYYSVAKWLAQRGFRTIINVEAYELDLQEAISNPNTSAMIWNSHGAEDGTILDSANVKIDEKIFTNLKTTNLKYILFANCFGYRSITKYELKDLEDVHSQGWDRLVNSDDLFRYIFSTDFDENLNKAFGKDIVRTPKKKIAI